MISDTGHSSPAERHLDPFMRPGRLRVVAESLLPGEWLCQHLAEFMEDTEVAFKGSTDSALDLVVTGNHDGIHASHLLGCLLPAAGLIVDPL